MKVRIHALDLSRLSLLLSSALMMALLMLVATPAARAGSDKHAQANETDIVDTAVAAGRFETLVTAIRAAGLAETLKSEGPFTVFAPTDEAFAKVSSDTLDALLKDKEALRKVLTYHVVPGKVTATDVVKLDKAETVQGQSVQISAIDGVMIDDARVTETDIMASNGVIHVIDTVLMPN